jgi:hypothetical protein
MRHISHYLYYCIATSGPLQRITLLATTQAEAERKATKIAEQRMRAMRIAKVDRSYTHATGTEGGLVPLHRFGIAVERKD